MRGGVWTAVALMALAGCVTDEPKPEPAAAACEGALADCGACPRSRCTDVYRETETPEIEPGEPEQVTEPFAFDGSTGILACPPDLPVRGHCAAVVDGDWSPPELEGARPLALHANVTHAGAVPSTQHYYVSLVVQFPSNKTWEWDPAREPGVEGVLPLTADFDLSGYPERTRFVVWVEAWHEAGPASVVTPEDYRVEGAFTHQLPLH